MIIRYAGLEHQLDIALANMRSPSSLIVAKIVKGLLREIRADLDRVETRLAELEGKK